MRFAESREFQRFCGRRFDRPGNYMFGPHSAIRAYRAAKGIRDNNLLGLGKSESGVVCVRCGWYTRAAAHVDDHGLKPCV